MEIVHETVVVKASIARIADELRHLEMFKDFMSNVEEIKILHRAEDRQISSWKVNVDGIDLAWVEEDCFVLDRGYMSFKMLEGDFDCFEGFWNLKPLLPNAMVGEQTDVELVVKYDLGLPSFDEIIGDVLRGKIIENSQSLLRALKRRAEIELTKVALA